MPRLIVAVIACWLVADVTPAAAQGRSGMRPIDLNAHSLRYWPHNALQRGQTLRAKTPHGILTCKKHWPEQAPPVHVAVTAGAH